MRWLWIDRVIELVPGQRMRAVKHVSLAEEHLHDHFAAGPAGPARPVMPTSLVIEGMAQTAGILVGHSESFRHKVILAKITRAELTEDATPGCSLFYTASIERKDPVGASTAGVVELADPGSREPPRRVGSIDLMFSHLDNNMQGLEFPDHNFVFGESFKTLLRASGVEWSA